MKPTKQLTVPQATSQARRHVDRIMPGVLATVESKLSHDLASDTGLVITTITFPKDHPYRGRLKMATMSLVGWKVAVLADSSLIITRSR